MIRPNVFFNVNTVVGTTLVGSRYLQDNVFPQYIQQNFLYLFDLYIT